MLAPFVVGILVLLAATEDAIVLHAVDALVGGSMREFGAPEADVRPAGEEVPRILAGHIDYWNLGRPVRELQALGARR